MLMSNDYFRRQPSLQTLRRTTVASLKSSLVAIPRRTAPGRSATIANRPKAVFSTHPFNGINTREGLFPEQLHEQGVRVCGVH
jgi:hypothetical protein